MAKNLWDELLDNLGVGYNDLNYLEKEHIAKLQQEYTKATEVLTLEGFKQYLNSIKGLIERELASEKLTSEQDLFLKARLRNCLEFLDFFEGPEKRKAEIEAQILSIKKKA